MGVKKALLKGLKDAATEKKVAIQTEFEKAHAIAQKNAALPVEQGGLGLPENNTAMDRARAMGFDVDNRTFRGIYGDYDASKAGNYQMFTKSPEDAGEYGNNVIPTVLNKGKNLTVNGMGNNFNSIPTSKLPKEVRDKLHPSVGDYARTDDISYAAKDAGYDTVSFDNVYDKASGEIPLKPKAKKDENVSQDLLDLLDEFEASGMGENSPKSYLQQEIPKNYDPATVDVAFNPQDIRSPNAAFDPLKRNSPNLLASAGAGAAVAGGALYTPEENQAQASVVDSASKFAARAADVELQKKAKNLGFSVDELKANESALNEIRGSLSSAMEEMQKGKFGQMLKAKREGKNLSVFDKSGAIPNSNLSDSINRYDEMLGALNLEQSKESPDINKLKAIKNRMEAERELFQSNIENAQISSMDNPLYNKGFSTNWQKDLEKGATTTKGAAALAALSGGANAIYDAAKNNTLGEAANYAQDAANMVGYIPTAGMMTTSDIIGGIGKAGAAATGNLDAYNREVSPYVERAGETQSQLGKQVEQAIGYGVEQAMPYVTPYVVPVFNNVSRQWEQIEANPGDANLFGFIDELNQKANVKLFR